MLVLAQNGIPVKVEIMSQKKVKVSKYQNEFMKSWFLQKYERNIIRIFASYISTLLTG